MTELCNIGIILTAPDVRAQVHRLHVKRAEQFEDDGVPLREPTDRLERDCRIVTLGRDQCNGGRAGEVDCSNTPLKRHLLFLLEVMGATNAVGLDWRMFHVVSTSWMRKFGAKPRDEGGEPIYLGGVKAVAEIIEGGRFVGRLRKATR